jgi:hypothetical protein
MRTLELTAIGVVAMVVVLIFLPWESAYLPHEFIGVAPVVIAPEGARPQMALLLVEIGIVLIGGIALAIWTGKKQGRVQ